MRTILVHLNVEVPDTTDAEMTATQIEGALSVGMDADNTPDLTPAGVNIVLAEEV